MTWLSLVLSGLALSILAGAFFIHFKTAVFGFNLGSLTGNGISDKSVVNEIDIAALSRRLAQMNLRMKDTEQALMSASQNQENFSSATEQPKELGIHATERDKVISSENSRLDRMARELNNVHLVERARTGGNSLVIIHEALSDLKLELTAIKKEVKKLTQNLNVRLDDLMNSNNTEKDEKVHFVLESADLVISASKMRTLGLAGQSFDTPLDVTLKLLSGGFAVPVGVLSALEVLKAYSQKGVSTRAALIDGLTEETNNMMHVEYSDSDTWLGKIFKSLSPTLRVQRIGKLDGDSSHARFAQAKALLSKGDLSAAINEISKLQGGASDGVLSWLEAARGRLAVEIALVKVESFALEHLAKSKNQPKSRKDAK